MSWYDKVNDSPWMGSICEVGIGVPFQASFLEVPGASKTILFTHCPYHKELQNLEFKNSRSVSYETASLYAWDDIYKIKNVNSGALSKNIFSIAVTASHKMSSERGLSHGWVVVLASREGESEYQEYSFHYRMPKILDRRTAGAYLVENIKWFLDKVLFGEYESWGEAIKNRQGLEGNYSRLEYLPHDLVSIDVIKAPDISIEEHLLLTDLDTPLIYHEGEFRRPADYLRRYNKVMPGSFNPPTIAHLVRGDGALFALDFNNARKETVSVEDMAHRIRMLDLEDIPVLITSGRHYVVYLHEIITEFGMEEPIFVVGSDTFNAVCNENYILSSDFLESLYSSNGVAFEVSIREGHDIVSNEWSNRMKVVLLKHADTGASSTQVRNGDLSLTTPSIRDYIRSRNLY